MKCLLIAATAAEIAPFVNHYHSSEKKTYIEFDLHIMVTGIGMMATTYQLTKYLQTNKPDLIIMVGIAGCFKLNVPLGKVFAVKSETFGDLGVREKDKWNDVFDLKIMPKNEAPFTNKKLVNTNKVILSRTRLVLINAITINQISTSKKAISILQKKYHPTIESMEGAALHYVALQQNIPFVQIRGVSNYIGERNKSKWKIKEAIENSNTVIIRLFESL
jgi:futalosine hydrolase